MAGVAVIKSAAQKLITEITDCAAVNNNKNTNSMLGTPPQNKGPPLPSVKLLLKTLSSKALAYPLNLLP